jgi:hypothetical protein
MTDASNDGGKNHRIKLLKRYFFNRNDIVAVQLVGQKNGKPRTRPVNGGEWFDGLVCSHVFGPSYQATVVFETRNGNTNSFLAAPRMGSYLPDPQGLTRWGCIDFDGHNHKDGLESPLACALDTMDRALALFLPCYLEQSGGGLGWHVWFFFADPISARQVRKLLFAVVTEHGYTQSGKHADPSTGAGIEVFPKQASLTYTEKRVGNMVWLPWWSGAPAGANEFYRRKEAVNPSQPWRGTSLADLEQYTPDEFAVITADAVTRIVGEEKKDAAEKDTPPDLMPNVFPDGFRPCLSKQDGEGVSRLPTLEPQAQCDRIEDALTYINPDVTYEIWVRVGMALQSFEPESGLALWDAWSAKGQKYREGETAAKWKSFEGSGVGIATIYDLAKSNGWDPSPTRFMRPLEGGVDDLLAAMNRKGEQEAPSERRGTPQEVTPAQSAQPAQQQWSRFGVKGGLPILPGRKPMVDIADRQPRAIVADSWEALIMANFPPWIFLRGGEAVWIRPRTRDTDSHLVGFDDAHLFGALIRHADFVKVSPENAICKNAYPPREIVRDMIAIPDGRLPPIDAVVGAPIFASTGKLLDQYGYTPEEEVFIDIDPRVKVDPVPQDPTPEDVARAISFFRDDLLVDFPFAGPSDFAHTLALFLLPFVRSVIHGCTPLHLIDASKQGSGKSLIAKLAGMICTGREVPAQTLPQTEDETRKRITAELGTGRRVICFDNAKESRTVNADSLSSVLTSTVWTDRLLGQSTQITYRNQAAWIVTANNIRVGPDMARRCVPIRLLAKEERPWERATFKHDPLEAWLSDHRGEAIWACLVLVQNWVAKGGKRSGHRLGSFDDWARVMGGILGEAGIPGFLANTRAMYDASDAEGNEWKRLVLAWWDTYRAAPMKAAELNNLCEHSDPPIMAPIRGDKGLRSQQIRLANALIGARDKIYNGLQVKMSIDPHTSTSCFHLVRVESERREKEEPQTEEERHILETIRMREKEVLERSMGGGWEEIDPDNYGGNVDGTG